MTTDVRGYLASKGLHLKTADKRNVNCSCFWCGEDPQKRGRLYINVDEDADIPGLFMCHICGEKGSLKKIQRYFGDSTDDKDPGVTFYDVLAAGATYFHKALNEHPAAVQYFEQERGLTRETIRKFKLGWADGKASRHLKSLGFTPDEIQGAGFVTSKGFEFFDGVYTIPYYIGATCVGVRQKEPGGKYKQPSGFGQRLFNIDSARGADEIILTEGEFDCMIAEQLGYAALGVPGATQWQESWNGYVRDAHRVWVVFDNDDAGRKNSAKIEETIGPRCKALTIPPKPQGNEDDHNDLSDWIVQEKHSQEDLAALLKKHRETLLITVSEAIQEWRQLDGLSGVKFGFEYLDHQLHPGLRPGEVVICAAKTGTGKTLWLLNTLDHMAQADPKLRFLFLSLEQTRADWFERARRIRAFFDDECFEMAPKSDDPDDLRRFETWASQRAEKFWTPRLMMTDRNRMSEEEIRLVLDDYKREMGALPDVVAIDYLGYLARGFKGNDRYHQTSDAAMAVKAIAKDYRIVILVPVQVNRTAKHGQRTSTDQARDSGAIEETGDFYFSLSNPDAEKTEGKDGWRLMEINKSRHGGDGTDVKYQWANQSLCLVPMSYGEELRFPNNVGRLTIAADETLRMAKQPSFGHVWQIHNDAHRTQ